MAQLAATGINDSPIVVITTPVTTGGKKRMIRAKNGVINKPISAEPITEPNTAAIPPPWVAIATRVATLANEVPWTSGSCDPNHGMPTDWRMVARPPMNRQQATSRPSCGAGTPGRRADDQGRGDDPAVHGEDVLGAEAQALADPQELVLRPLRGDLRTRCAHDPTPQQNPAMPTQAASAVPASARWTVASIRPYGRSAA